MRAASLPPPALRVTPAWCLADDDGNGGGGGPVDGSGGGGGDGDGDGDGDESASGALAKAGLDADSLPEDLLEALKAGRIGSTELANWKSVVSNPLTKVLAMSAFIRARLLADPRLATVLGIECGVGCLSTLAAEKAARGDKFRQELDFVLANQVQSRPSLTCPDLP